MGCVCVSDCCLRQSDYTLLFEVEKFPDLLTLNLFLNPCFNLNLPPHAIREKTAPFPAHPLFSLHRIPINPLC